MVKVIVVRALFRSILLAILALLGAVDGLQATGTTHHPSGSIQPCPCGCGAKAEASCGCAMTMPVSVVSDRSTSCEAMGGCPQIDVTVPKAKPSAAQEGSLLRVKVMEPMPWPLWVGHKGDGLSELTLIPRLGSSYVLKPPIHTHLATWAVLRI